MKAIISTGYGSPEVLQLKEVNKPAPNNNEVLIKVHVSAVTRAGTMIRTGKPYIGRLFLGLFKPKHAIPGTAFAGVIVKVGQGASVFKIGDKVFGESIVTFGAHAEYICLPEDGVISTMPEKMTFEQAAPITDGPLTSINFLKNIAKIQAGQKVLINGASGSLGTSAIQLAKYYGAHVTGICSTKNVSMVSELGANQVIDYTKEDFTNNNQTYDIIYDTIGQLSFSACKNSLNKNGVYVSPVLDMRLLFDMIWTSIFGGKKAKFSATGIQPVPELRKLFQEIKKIITEGKLKSIIDRRYSIDQIADAHKYIDKGHKKGNVVLNLVPEYS